MNQSTQSADASSPLKSGSVREAARLDPDLAMKVRLCASDAEGQARLAQAFEGFVPREEVERLKNEVEHWHRARQAAIEGGNILKDDLTAAQADNAKLREVLAKYDFLAVTHPHLYQGGISTV